MIRNVRSFCAEEMLAPRPTPMLEGHPLSTVIDCLFGIFARTFHAEGRFCTRDLRMRHAVATRGPLFYSSGYIYVEYEACRVESPRHGQLQKCMAPSARFPALAVSGVGIKF